jgi:hypothetical protein
MNKPNEYIKPDEYETIKPDDHLYEYGAKNSDYDITKSNKRKYTVNKKKIIAGVVLLLVVIIVPVTVVKVNQKTTSVPSNTMNATSSITSSTSSPLPTCTPDSGYFISGIPGCPSNVTNARAFNTCYINNADVYLTFSINCLNTPLSISMFNNSNCGGTSIGYTLSSACQELNLGLLESFSNVSSYWIKT